MWKLVEVSAKNICAFEELEYQLNQSHTTLIMGRNKDNDSQGSNGSGKSTILEAIALGITGEPLRKVKMDEIIRDGEDKTNIELSFLNTSTGREFSVSRCISRSNPQTVVCKMTNEDGDINDIPQSSVANYNQYILDTLGLSKEDIYSNFILSKNKYISFLSSSDRDKKSLINRFSNGDMVDEAIGALIEDESPIEVELQYARDEVANYEGRVSALIEQIDDIKNSSEEREESKKKRIQDIHNNIKDSEDNISNIKKSIAEKEKEAKILSKVNNEAIEYEDGNPSLSEAYKYLKDIAKENKIGYIGDYEADSKSIVLDIKNKETELKGIAEDIDKANKELKIAESNKKENESSNEKFLKTYETKTKSIKESIQCTISNISACDEDIKELRKKKNKLNEEVSELKGKLFGVITCPKCKHEFTLDNDFDIESTKKELEEKLNKIVENETKIENVKQEQESYYEEKDKLNKKLDKYDEELRKSKLILSESLDEFNESGNKIRELNKKKTSCEDSIESLKKELGNLRNNMFDEFYDLIDIVIKKLESDIKKDNIDISNALGVIESYKESLEKTRNSSVDDTLTNLSVSKDKYQKMLEESNVKMVEVENKLNELKRQESLFVEFKTHLANTKIESLSNITNGFLEKIGSDIRIKFSGYTVLKTGKVRDKISISLLRNGVDCGSFGKFSEGEKCRVELANILALHELSNMNCEDSKGLDLLVLDEILDACDEQGLSSMFNALNQLSITSLVVSQGNIAEGYPYKLVVNKLNGVSYINDKEE